MESTLENKLTPEQMDTIGEIMNISMGSAATAVSTMLEKQVSITTPQLTQEQFKNIDCSSLEPSLLIKVNYVSGIQGTNVIMLRQHDMQIILDILMGNDISVPKDDFEFDEMSMSAACEVMNQMMGSSATALSETLDMPINISTPEAMLCDKKNDDHATFWDIGDEDDIVAISFQMMIKDVLDTTFTCFLSTELVIRIISHINGAVEEDVTPPPFNQNADLEMQNANLLTQEVDNTTQAQINQNEAFGQMPNTSQDKMANPPGQTQQTPPPSYAQGANPGSQAQGNQQMNPAHPPVEGQNYGMPPQMPYAPNGYPPYGQYPPQYFVPPYGYPQQQAQAYGKPTTPITAQKAEYPNFSQQPFQAEKPIASNMELLMGVHLEVSVIIGRTKQKIKDILDFGQGSVVELDTQTGAPAQLVVNGQLLAYGDVVVVGDNFGLRITEIVGTKELLDSLGSNGTI